MIDDRENHPTRTRRPSADPAAPPPDPAPEAPGAIIEPTEQAAAPRGDDELAALKDRYLRLAADFENFRRRTTKERAEAWERAQADLVLRLTEALDDLARFASVDPAETDAGRLHAGVELVERKLWKELSALGVSRVDQTGVPFDPNVHEAVTTGPAPEPAADHTVGAVLQAGYKFRDQLLRPARVQVLTWSGDGSPH
jgi:molecular chaperone GrpE